MDSLDSIAAYPTEREDWVKTVLIGGIFSFFGFLIIPLFFVYGYVVRVIRHTFDGKSEPPPFDDWGELFVDGLLAWIIVFVYMLVPLIVAAVTVGTAVISLVLNPSPAALSGVFLGMFVSGLLALAFGYVAVAAVVNFARKQRFQAAFDLTFLRGILFHREFATAWAVSLVGFIVAGVIGSIPAIGWIVAPFVGFYAAVVAGNLWASGFSAALEPVDGTEPVREDRSAV